MDNCDKPIRTARDLPADGHSRPFCIQKTYRGGGAFELPNDSAIMIKRIVEEVVLEYTLYRQRPSVCYMPFRHIVLLLKAYVCVAYSLPLALITRFDGTVQKP